MLAQIVEQRVGAHERLVEVQIELAVVEQQSEGALVAVELGGKLLHIGYGLVDLGHGTSHIHCSQIAGESLGIVEHSVGLGHHAGHVAVEGTQQGVELAGRGVEVGGDAFDIVQRVGHGGIGEQRIETRHDRVELGQHLSDGGGELCHGVHQASVDSAGDGVAGLNGGGRVVTEQEIDLEVAHHVALYLGGGAGRDDELAVGAEAHDDAAAMGIVEIDGLDCTHLVAVDKDGIGGSKSADVVKLGKVYVVVGEEALALQKIHAEKEQNDAHDGC